VVATDEPSWLAFGVVEFGARLLFFVGIVEDEVVEDGGPVVVEG